MMSLYCGSGIEALNTMASGTIPILCGLLLCLCAESVWSSPAGFYHDPESPHPLAAVSELSSRLAAHAQRDDARLPLPTPQELEAIKKVAQILIMLGEQVIPAIIGDPPSTGNCENTEDVPNDIVKNP